MRHRSLLAVSGVLVAGIAAGLLPAGPLDPPAGPILPSYKTLTEVEPRTPLNAVTMPGDANSICRINKSGSYFLTGNIQGVSGKHGIEIAASHVTIDLNGFAVQGVAGSLFGIETDSLRNNLTIRNGVVSGWGGPGIDLLNGGDGTGSMVEGVHASLNGGVGIRTANNTLVRACTATSNAQEGIATLSSSVVEFCSARLNTGTGIITGTDGVVSRCVASFNTGDGIVAAQNAEVVHCSSNFNSDDGIVVGTASDVASCTAIQNSNSGINAGSGSSVTGCRAETNTLHGISVTSNCQVRGNNCNGNGLGGNGAGIIATADDNRIEENNCTDNDWGVRVTAGGNFIARNICSGNTTNWDILTGNKCLVILGVSAGAISGNSGGADPGSSNPNANFTY